MASEKTESARPKVQTSEDVVKQAHEDARSPADKHKAYLETLERLHSESVVGPDKKTPPVG